MTAPFNNDDPGQHVLERIDSDDIIKNPNYPPYPPNVVKTWRIGSQLRHAMETESAIQGHQQGAIEFIRILKEFKEDDLKQVRTRDIDIILEIIVTFDRHDLLKLLINHPYLSDFLSNSNNALVGSDNDNDNKMQQAQPKKMQKPLQSSLKKAIRAGKIKVLNYLITQDIISVNLFNDNIQSKQYETDLKSLLFTILRGIEIGSKKKSKTQSNCFKSAKLFWPYLARKVFDLKQSLIVGDNDNDNDIGDDGDMDIDGHNALKRLISLDDNTLDLKDKILINKLKSMNNDNLIIKYISLFMPSMIKQRMNNDQYIAIFNVLRFLRERYITFETRNNIVNQNGWIIICNQLIINYLDNYKVDSDCLELEIIYYLISGGIECNIINLQIKNNKYLQQVIKQGVYNWNMKNWKLNKIKEVMPSVLPIEINKLIIYTLCL